MWSKNIINSVLATIYFISAPSICTCRVEADRISFSSPKKKQFFYFLVFYFTAEKEFHTFSIFYFSVKKI